MLQLDGRVWVGWSGDLRRGCKAVSLDPRDPLLVKSARFCGGACPKCVCALEALPPHTEWWWWSDAVHACLQLSSLFGGCKRLCECLNSEYAQSHSVHISHINISLWTLWLDNIQNWLKMRINANI
jgi:hypothetical protein